MALKKFCLFFPREISWNLLRFTVPPNCQPHPSENTHFPARIFCLHCLGLCWPQAALGVQCLSHCTAVPKPRLSKYIYIMLQFWVIPLNLIAKVLGQWQKGGGTGADAFSPKAGWVCSLQHAALKASIRTCKSNGDWNKSN